MSISAHLIRLKDARKNRLENNHAEQESCRHRGEQCRTACYVWRPRPVNATRMLRQLSCVVRVLTGRTAPPLRRSCLPLSLRACKGNCVQILPESISVAIVKESLNFAVDSPPDGKRTRKEPASLGCQRHNTASPVSRVHRHRKQAAAPQWLHSGSQCRSVHSEQGRNCPHVWRFWTVQRHHQRELSIGKSDWA